MAIWLRAGLVAGFLAAVVEGIALGWQDERQVSGNPLDPLPYSALLLSIWIATGLLAGYLSTHRRRPIDSVRGGALAGALSWLALVIDLIVFIVIDPQFQGVDVVAALPSLFAAHLAGSLPVLGLQFLVIGGVASIVGVLINATRRRAR